MFDKPIHKATMFFFGTTSYLSNDGILEGKGQTYTPTKNKNSSYVVKTEKIS